MADTTALLGTWKMTSWKREIVANGEKIDASHSSELFINCQSS
jgi:hypothetical protein